jgi:hypothetical protein
VTPYRAALELKCCQNNRQVSRWKILPMEPKIPSEYFLLRHKPMEFGGETLRKLDIKVFIKGSNNNKMQLTRDVMCIMMMN